VSVVCDMVPAMMGDHVLSLPVSDEWRCAITDFVASLRAGGTAETTIKTRVQHLERLSRGLGVSSPAEVEAGALVAWAGQQAWAVETRRSFRATCRRFFGWMAATGRAPADASAQLPRVRPAEPVPRPTPELVYSHALSRADERGRIILRLAGEVGLRRAEIAVVHERDVLADLTGRSLIVHGKGRRDRIVPLPEVLSRELVAAFDGSGWLLPGRDGGHLSPRYVGKIAAELLPAGYTLHTLRHRFATRAYGVARDTFAVQSLLGHASPATTRRYVAVPAEHLRATVEAIA
jgi:integrase/recombinase XerC